MGLPSSPFLSGWRLRGMQLAEAIAETDPVFAEKLAEAKAKRREMAKKLVFQQRPIPSLVERFDTHDGIVIARRGFGRS